MLRSVKVATPSTARTVTLPDILAPAGPVAMATVTYRVEPVRALPCASRIETSTGGIVWLATEVLGCFRKASLGGDVTSMGLLLAHVRSLASALSVYAPGLLMISLEKTATPAAADKEVIPDRMPPGGLVPSDMVILGVAVDLAFPWASCTVTFTGPIGTPADATVGWTVKASLTGTRSGWDAKPPESQAASNQSTCNAALLSVLDIELSSTSPPEGD